MNDGIWFKMMKGTKKALPPASLPVVSLPAALPAGLAIKISLPAAPANLLGMLGLVPALVPGDGNCALYCEVAILKEADSMKHAKTTHDSLRAEMCLELLENSNAYEPYHVGNKASYQRYVDRMKISKTYVDHLGLQALAAVYPNELGRIVILSIHTGKVVQHHFMDSSDPSMKEFSKDATLTLTLTLKGLQQLKQEYKRVSDIKNMGF